VEKALLPNGSPDSRNPGARLVPAPENSLCFENANGLVESAQGLLRQRPAEVVVELGKVELIDSSGLRALLHIRRACEDAGVLFRLGSVSQCVDRIIAMSKLDSVFGVPRPHGDTRPAKPGPALDLQAPGWRIHEYCAVSDPSVISRLRERAMQAAIEAGAQGDMLCDIQVAVGEALTNAYKHGSPRKGTSQIQMRCMSCPAAIVVEVQDEGPVFDPNGASIPDPYKMRDHGMGIYLMREAMDLVEFESGCPGNRVRMVKWLRNGD